MKQRITAILLVLALVASLGAVSVLAEEIAADGSAEKAAETKAAETTAPAKKRLDPVTFTIDHLDSIGFAQLDQRIRGHNLSLLAMEEGAQTLEAMNYKEMKGDLKDAMDLLEQQKEAMQNISMGFGNIAMLDAESMAVDGELDEELGNTIFAINQAITGINMTFKQLAGLFGSTTAMSLEQSYNSLEETYDSIGKMERDNKATIRQIRSGENQLVMGGQTLYITLNSLTVQEGALQRQLNALNRTVEEMELRHKIGQISSLQLQQIKSGQTALISGLQTLQMNTGNLRCQLEMMLGAEITGQLKLGATPTVSADQLNAMNVEADLAAAKQQSYELYAAEKKLDDAQRDYKETKDEYGGSLNSYQYAMAKHTWQGAQYTYAASVQDYENRFRSLYRQVKDNAQILEAAKVALACEQANCEASELRFKQGTISENAVLDARDSLKTAEEKVASASSDLFAAYNNYRWAVDHGVLN